MITIFGNADWMILWAVRQFGFKATTISTLTALRMTMARGEKPLAIVFYQIGEELRSELIVEARKNKWTRRQIHVFTEDANFHHLRNELGAIS